MSTRPIPISTSSVPPREPSPYDQPLGRSMEAVFEVPSPTSHGLHMHRLKSHRPRDKRKASSSGSGGGSKVATRSATPDKQQQQQQRKKYERQASQENNKRRSESKRYSNGVSKGDFVPAVRTQSFHATADEELSLYCVKDERLCMRHDLKDDFFGSEIPLMVPYFHAADLAHNQLTRFPSCFQLAHLKELLLSHNNLTEFVVTRDMPHLAVLELQGNSIRQFPSSSTLRHLPSLRRLELYNNNISILPPDTCELLGNLEELNLSFNKLQELPSEIAFLQNLKKLNLSYNFLTELPYQIRELRGLRRLELRNNDLQKPPQEWARRGLSAIFDFFNRTHQGCSRIISQRKVIVLGDRDAGLLSVVEHLQDVQGAGGEAELNVSVCTPTDDGDNAVTLRIRDWSYSEQGVIKLWLFPGQFSEGQLQMFFADNPFFLLVWNIQQCFCADDIQRFVIAWVDLILAKLGRQCRIFLVPNGLDAVAHDEALARLALVQRCLDKYLDQRAKDLDECRDGQARYLASLKSPFVICPSIADLRREVQAVLQPSNELVHIPQYFFDVRNVCERKYKTGQLVATLEEIRDALNEDLTLQEVTYALSYLNRLGDEFLMWVEGSGDTNSDVDSLTRHFSNGTPLTSGGHKSLKHSTSSSLLDDFVDADDEAHPDDDLADGASAEFKEWMKPSARRLLRKHSSFAAADVTADAVAANEAATLERAKSTGHLRQRKSAATPQRSYAEAARGSSTPKLTRVDTSPVVSSAEMAPHTPLTESSVSRLTQQPFNLSNYVFLNVDWFATQMSTLMRRLQSLPRSGPKLKDGAISGDELGEAIKKNARDQPELIWTLLERLLVKFHFIIPVHDDNLTPCPTPQGASTPVALSRDSSESAWRVLHRLYIAPTFLPVLDSVPVLPTLGMGEIMLEHQFHFGRYVPPDLVSLILAHSKHTHLSPRELDVSINDEFYIALACENACWRNALKQFRTLPTGDNRYTSIVMWIVVEGNVVRVVGIGQLIRQRMILQHLEEYCKLVQDVLAELPGLYHVQEYMLCSKCLLEQRQLHKCGRFLWDVLAQDRAQRALMPGIPIRKHCGTCNQSINLEELVYMETPTVKYASDAQSADRDELLATIQQLEGAMTFLLQECVRQASVPLDRLRRSVCRIGVLHGDRVEFRGSGAVFIDKQGRLLVATANHLFANAPGRKVVVLGTETHWVATVFEPVNPKLALLYIPKSGGGQLRSADQQDWSFLVPNKLVQPLLIQGTSTPVSRQEWTIESGRSIPTLWSETQASLPDFPFTPLTAASEEYPQPEQFVRLLGFPGNYSLSSSCGRVIQPNANGFIIVDTYSDQGSSGGPLVGGEGQLFGVLSSSYTSQRFARVQPLLPALQAAEAILEKAYAHALQSFQAAAPKRAA